MRFGQVLVPPAAQPLVIRRRWAMTYDYWLDRWLPLLIERADGGPILEIGCGAGEDTARLASGGLTVIAFDCGRRRGAKRRLGATELRSRWVTRQGTPK